MVFDSQNQKAILFGGRERDAIYGDTWSYDYATNKWQNMNPVNAPRARYNSGSAYDSDSKKMVIFGGDISFSGSAINETWAYDYAVNRWQNMYPINPPSIRSYPALAYDSKNHKIIMFGGDSTLNDTWVYDYATNKWQNMNPVNPPPGRIGSGMIYDSVNEKVIMFGGASSGIQFNDTWTYDYATNKWQNMNPVNPPSARQIFGFVYGGSKIYLFGGRNLALSDPNDKYNDLWSYDYSQNLWTKIISANPADEVPDKRYGLTMVYDENNHKIIMSGGYVFGARTIDTWTYDTITNLWEPMMPPSTLGVMVVDKRGTPIIFGGCYMDDVDAIARNSIWQYDLASNNWQRLKSNGNIPAGRKYASGFYDAKRDRLFIFAGRGNMPDTSIKHDAWVYDFATNNWQELNMTNAPTAVSPIPFVFDENGDIIWGPIGYQVSTNDYRTDMWKFDFVSNNWQTMNSLNQPLLIWDGKMVKKGDDFLLFGAWVGAEYPDSVLIYNFTSNSWRNLNISFTPSRAFDCMIREGDYVYLFGGTPYFPDLGIWVFDLTQNTWTRITDMAFPSRDGLFSYDEINKVGYLYGGYGYSEFKPSYDTWLISWNVSPVKPVVITGQASVSSDSVVLNGILNPKGLDVLTFFEWGETSLYGNTTAIQSFTGDVTVNVSANLFALTPSTTYHFRLVATTGTVTYYGTDKAFTTSPTPLPVTTYTFFFNPGWNMITLPLATDPDPYNAFENSFPPPPLLPESLPPGWSLFAWDPLGGRYLDKDEILLKSGQGYWLKTSASSFAITGAIYEGQLTVDLAVGWNMVGQPYLASLSWSGTRISYQGSSYTLDQAAALGLISNALYAWDGSSYINNWGQSFPVGQGAWLRAKISCQLIFSNPL